MKKVIIGSRGSDLALWQAYYVRDRLAEIEIEAEIKIIKTRGDRIQHLSFDKMEGKGFFTKEIEAALLEGDIDIAVHSHKDLETTEPEGLTIAAVSSREDPADLMLIRRECTEPGRRFQLKKNAVVGTSSARRKAQILGFCPDVTIEDIRGNVPSRIQKLRDQNFDAILIAYAGVHRLGIDLSEFEVIKMNPREFVPAPAQGVLGIQVRDAAEELITALSKLNDDAVEECISVERETLRLFHGGCQMPLGVYCVRENGGFTVFAAKAETWNSPVKSVKITADSTAGLAEKTAKALSEQR